MADSDFGGLTELVVTAEDDLLAIDDLSEIPITTKRITVENLVTKNPSVAANTAKGQGFTAAGVGPTTIVADTVVETITPGAGTYLAIFSGYADVTTSTGTYTYRIRANGVDNAASERVHDNTGKVAFADVPLIVHTIALVTVADTEAIDIEFTDGVGTTTVINQSLILIKVA